MAVYDLTKLQDEEVIFHFGGRLNEVDAYTFANTLLALADGLRAVNQQVNPDFAIEIRIDALGGGSFRARLKTFKKKLSSLFGWSATNIVAPILVSIILHRYLGPETPNITVKGDVYIYNYGDDKVVVSEDVYQRQRTIKDRVAIEKQISRAFSVLEEDPSVESFGFTSDLHDEGTDVDIPRTAFPTLSQGASLIEEEDGKRIIERNGHIVIRKVILEKSNRKWQFVWNGVPISAPIKDDGFYERMARREIVFAQGDALNVRLRIRQVRDIASGAWINESYEVIEVLGILEAAQQRGLLDMIQSEEP
jgi:hypothetical protein